MQKTTPNRATSINKGKTRFFFLFYKFSIFIERGFLKMFCFFFGKGFLKFFTHTKVPTPWSNHLLHGAANETKLNPPPQRAKDHVKSKFRGPKFQLYFEKKFIRSFN